MKTGQFQSSAGEPASFLSSRRLVKTVHGLIYLAVLSAIVWLMLRDQARTYDGLTAREWFSGWTHHPDDDAFKKALYYLNSDFIPVLTGVLKQRHPAFHVEYNDLWLLLPENIQKAFPNPVPLRMSRESAYLALRMLVEVRPDMLPQLKAEEPLFRILLTYPEEDMAHSSALSWWYALSTGDLDPDKPKAGSYLNSSDDLVRLAAALRVSQRGQDHALAECEPILSNMATNSNEVVEIFGSNAGALIRVASEALRRIEAATPTNSFRSTHLEPALKQ